jgi:very-short-patch-repair endonuclease
MKKFLSSYPELVKEWHPTKNGELTPNDFTHGSSKKVWWMCPRGHEYESVINSRTKGTGCRSCSRQSSQPEIRILTELKYLFKEVTSRYKVEGVEIDIFVPKYNLGIEYDGHYFHKNKKEKDLVKNKFLESKDITLIRIRESPLEKLSSNDLIVRSKELTKKDLNRLVHQMNSSVHDMNIHVGDYLKLTDFVNTRMFNEFISCFPSPFPDLSLFNTHPDLSKEWDYESNYPLTPKDFSYGSDKKIWWKCEIGHEYECEISRRARKEKPTGCSFCSGRFPTKENNLLILFPKVSKEWHPTKNGDLVPEDFTGRSHKKVWWECKKGHEWESIISNRTKSDKPTGCSSCSGNKPSKENNLLVLFPQVAKEWHPIKNGKLTPEDFTYGSGKKVWWECKKGHEWEARIHKRTRKEKPTGCSFCSGRKKEGW